MALYIIKSPDGSQRGPYTSAEIRQSIRRGRIRGSDLIRTTSSPRWRTIAEVPALAAELETANAREAAKATDADSSTTAPSMPQEPESPDPEEPPTGAATPVATNPAAPSIDLELGFADRVLRLGFGIGRWVSVLIIGAAVIGFFGGLAVLGWTLIPRSSQEPAPGPLLLTPPAAFIAACQPTPRNQSQTNSTTTSGSGPQLRVDPCQAWRPRIQSICSLLRATRLESSLCDTLRRDVETQDEDAFLAGLADTAKAWAGITPQPPACTAEQLVEWYIDMYKDAARRRMAPVVAHRQAEAAAAEAQARASATAQWAIVVSLGALIVFLFLPLLIQIERNTRPLFRLGRAAG